VANDMAIGGEVVNLYKKLGETPRERLERLRTQKAQFRYEVLSYAGRLDPMAEGVLLCLSGAANSRHDNYLDLSKEYVVDILFGFATDLYDILGKVLSSGDAATIHRKAVQYALNEFRGTVSQEYPPFSSKPVDGKSLFQWARAGMLGSIALPQKDVTIHEIELRSMYKIKEPALLGYIEDAVGKVHGDFRQDEILTAWNRYLSKKGTREFPCVSVFISCTSGTYARSIANQVGQRLGVPALAIHILRTKVGEYDISKSLK
jgi:tRNA pseudouridine55 synthase